MHLDFLDKIKEIKHLGSGGFGDVILCKYEGKKYALKKIPYYNNKKKDKSCTAEAMALICLQHPCLVKYEGMQYSSASKQFCFLLEYVENGTLADLIASTEKFEQNDLLSKFMDIARGIRYLHHNLIIHRDLKPENVLVDKNYRLKIADFGIAKFLRDNVAGLHTAIGTKYYIAPEVEERKPYDNKVDIWALGIIFYEMAMAERIYTLPSLSSHTPSIELQRRNYSSHVADFSNWMLRKDPQRRPDIDSIWQFLKRFL